MLNQGTSEGTNLRLTCKLEDGQEFVSGSGSSAVTSEGGQIRIAPIASLAPKETLTWIVIVKAKQAGDIRFSVELMSDQLNAPVREDEATQQY